VTTDRIEYVTGLRKNIDFPTEWYEANSEDHFWFQWRARATAALITRIGLPTREKLRVFDIGCGTGITARQLSRTTSWVFDGADLNVEALRRCTGGFDRVLYYDVLERSEELRGRYDVAILFDVIEHIEEPRSFLEAVLVHLKPGGMLLVNVPALMALFSVYDTAVGHCRRYDKAMLAAEFSGLDAAVVDQAYWGFSMIPLLMARKLVLRHQTDEAQTIRTGIVPPSPAAHALLKGMMSAETALVRRPPLGSSLLAAIKKGA
jgi:2-polyprenyl-3-methyl-5-hydroxy-6-metoxy-1,4-benzoquinol methylase